MTKTSALCLCSIPCVFATASDATTQYERRLALPSAASIPWSDTPLYLADSKARTSVRLIIANDTAHQPARPKQLILPARISASDA